jgi:putative phosphonate metabolism protein
MRYAIYYAPPQDSPLWLQGSRWLGWDAISGHPLPQPRFRDIDADNLAELTRTPARYGFHATLMAPFRLKTLRSAAELEAAVDEFAARQQPIALPSLILAQLDHCFCLRPARHVPALQSLSSMCTREFDRFRAPLHPSELARRKAAQLSGQEKKNLELWGYPYVFEQFRFHFTLTTRVTEVRHKERVHAALLAAFGPLLDTSLEIESVCLFVEPSPGQPMRCLHRFPFSRPRAEAEERISHDQPPCRQNIHPGHQCHPA